MKAFKKMAAVTAAMTILLSANMTFFPNNLTAQFAITASAADIVDSGTCGAQGDNLTWTLDSSGILTISGIGEMKNWKSYDSPWGFREEIKKVVIEEGVTSIGYSAFYHCSGITSISFPKSVAAISMEAFEKTQWLENQLDAGPFVIVNGILIDGRYCEGSVTTPGGVHSIGEGAFFWNGDITSIKIADGVTSIGASAFSQCNYLKTVTLPNSLRTIETYAFQKCNQLRTITIPNGIKQIASYAFIDCPSLTEIALPSSIASIGKGAFFKCNSLSSVTIKNADCEIEDSEGTIPQTATIYGYDDSTAQRYAKKMTSTLYHSVKPLQQIKPAISPVTARSTPQTHSLHSTHILQPWQGLQAV